MKVHSFAVWNLELGGELSYSGHVVSLYQLLQRLLVSQLQRQTKHPATSDSHPSGKYYIIKYYFIILYRNKLFIG